VTVQNRIFFTYLLPLLHRKPVMLNTVFKILKRKYLIWYYNASVLIC